MRTDRSTRPSRYVPNLKRGSQQGGGREDEAGSGKGAQIHKLCVCVCVCVCMCRRVFECECVCVRVRSMGEKSSRLQFMSLSF